jgi:7-cyano-7-deazaguanine reductase
MPRYTPEHAKAGLDTKFPQIETWPNQFPGYEIVIDDPEFTSLKDVVRWAKPIWAEVKGDFRPRGGISTVVIAKWPRPKARKQS